MNEGLFVIGSGLLPHWILCCDAVGGRFKVFVMFICCNSQGGGLILAPIWLFRAVILYLQLL